MERSRRNSLATQIYDAAKEVHSITGAGVTAVVFRACMAHELRLRGLRFRILPKIPVIYKGLKVDVDVFADFLIEEEILVMIEQGDQPDRTLANLHTALRFSGLELGVLLDISNEKMIDGFKKVQKLQKNQ